MPPRTARVVLFACGVALSSACSDPDAVFSHEPIPLSLAGNSGGLLGLGTAGARTQPFPMLVDTASPLTSYSDGASAARATRGDLRLYGNVTGTGEVPRLELPGVQLFVTAIAGTGLDQANPISGVLGGDNLRRFVMSLSYAGAPNIELTDQLILSDCELSERCGAVLPFSVAGGHQLIDIGPDIYTYPASYVLLDACLEPSIDPLEADITCRDRGCVIDCPTALGKDRDKCLSECSLRRDACGGSCSDCDDLCGNTSSAECSQCLADTERYLPHGIDVRFAVATGFPGIALTAAAYDRLRGRGSASTLIGASAHTLFLPDQTSTTSGIKVGVDTLGVTSTGTHDAAARAGMALVGRRGYFGACAELARSRRLRRVQPELPVPAAEATCLRSPARNPKDALFAACANTNSSGICDDADKHAETTPYTEIAGPLPIIVVPDTTSLLQSINADVRPDSATVEGVIGTEMLRRLGTTIDYPNGRVITTCADASCKTFPQWGHGTECQLPTGDFVFGGGRARTIVGASGRGVGGCAIP